MVGDRATTIVEGTGRVRSAAQRRFQFLRLLFLIVIGLIVTRSFYLQVVEGGAFHLQAEGNRVALVPLVAPRGIMYDHRGVQLVENIASTDVVLDPTLLPQREHEAPLIDLLPEYVGLNVDEVRARLESARRSQQVTVLAKALPHEDVIRLEGALDSLPGVQLSSSSVRNYLYPFELAHTLGYTGSVTAEELEETDDLLLTEATGKAGIEKSYNELLRGYHGAAYIEVDVHGRQQKSVGEEAPRAGTDMHLTLDAELQQFAFNVLAEYISQPTEEGAQPTAGAVVALDPRSGAVRALVNYPSFDPNAFSQPARRDDVGEYIERADQPLFNRSIAGTYPPGSTIKPPLAAAGLEEGLITKDTTIVSSGGITIGPWSFPDWRAGGHGTVNVTAALADSVNTFFYILAGGDATHDGLGVETATSYLEEFSWGSRTGIDLPGEAAGFLPSPEWKEAVKGERWYIGDTYHLGIGQGDVLVTPVQVASATAALAGGGTLHTPYVLERAVNGERIVRHHESRGYQLPVRAQHVATVRGGMREAVTAGSARRLQSLPIDVAGKTGTAQFSEEDATHAWFTSFGPYDAPELVLTILLERGGKGDVAAVPIAHEIWQWWVENRHHS